MTAGDKVYTPRFCTVTIAHVYSSEREARKDGFDEPTYYAGDADYDVRGRVIGINRMDFAAVRK